MSGNNFELGKTRLPGLTPEVAQESRQFLLDNNHILRRGVRIEKDSTDDSHTGKEYKLQPGLALVRIEEGANKGKYVPPDHADAPDAGDVVMAGILMEYVDMRKRSDPEDVEDQQASVLIHGKVDAAQIIYADASYEDEIKDVLPGVFFEVEQP